MPRTRLKLRLHSFSSSSLAMEMERFELLTPCLQGRCSPNWATPPYYVLFGPWSMGLSGLEPPTSRLSGVCSNRLSYKPVYRWNLYLIKFGIHLLSHIVSNIVPSAVQGLTIVFGMFTGVSLRRIDTKGIEYLISTSREFSTEVVPLNLSSINFVNFRLTLGISFKIKD